MDTSRLSNYAVDGRTDLKREGEKIWAVGLSIYDGRKLFGFLTPTSHVHIFTQPPLLDLLFKDPPLGRHKWKLPLEDERKKGRKEREGVKLGTSEGRNAERD